MGGGQTKPQNVYVAEIDTGRIVRGGAGVENISGNDDSPVEQGERITISYDGKRVAFTTKATNLGGKIIVKNIDTGEIIPFDGDFYGLPIIALKLLIRHFTAATLVTQRKFKI